MSKPRIVRGALSRVSAGPAASALYDRHAAEISVLLGWFFLRHLNDLYRKFDGDLLLALVLGEIAHHNICHHYSGGRRKAGRAGGGAASPDDASLEPCNPFSLAAAIGIPRETCRRKVQELARRGWVCRHERGGFVIPRDIATHFRPNNVRSFVDLLDLIRDLDHILHGPARAHARRGRGGHVG